MDIEHPDALTHWEYQRRMFSYKAQVGIIKERFKGKQPVIVDIGCGAGDGTDFLSEHFDNVLGLDNNPHVLRNIGHYKCWDAEKDDVPPCDVVVSNQFIEHLREPDKLLSKVFKALRPGGMFIGSTPDRECRIRNGEKPYNPDHFEEYTPDTLKSLFSSDNWGELNILGVYIHRDIAKWESIRISSARIKYYDPYSYWGKDELQRELNGYIQKLFLGFIKSRIPDNIDGEPFMLAE